MLLVRDAAGFMREGAAFRLQLAVRDVNGKPGLTGINANRRRAGVRVHTHAAESDCVVLRIASPTLSERFSCNVRNSLPQNFRHLLARIVARYFVETCLQRFSDLNLNQLYHTMRVMSYLQSRFHWKIRIEF